MKLKRTVAVISILAMMMGVLGSIPCVTYATEPTVIYDFIQEGNYNWYSAGAASCLSLVQASDKGFPTEYGTLLMESTNWGNPFIYSNAINTNGADKLLLNFEFYATGYNNFPKFYVTASEDRVWEGQTVTSQVNGTDFNGFYSNYTAEEASAPLTAMTDGWWTTSGKSVTGTVGNWYKVETLYDLKNETIKVYVDGELVGEGTGPSDIKGITIKLTHAATSGGTLYFKDLKLTDVTEVIDKDLTVTNSAEYETDNASEVYAEFSETVPVLDGDELTVTNLESGEAVEVVSVDKVSPYVQKIVLEDENKKSYGEYKFVVNDSAFAGSLGGKLKDNTFYANACGEIKELKKELADGDFPNWTNGATTTQETSNDITWNKNKSMNWANMTSYKTSDTFDGDAAADDKLRIEARWTTSTGGASAGASAEVNNANCSKIDVEFDAGFQNNFNASDNTFVDNYNGLTSAYFILYAENTNDAAGTGRPLLALDKDAAYACDQWGNLTGADYKLTGTSEKTNNMRKANHYKVTIDFEAKNVKVVMDGNEQGAKTQSFAGNSVGSTNLMASPEALTGLGFMIRTAGTCVNNTDGYIAALIDNVKITKHVQGKETAVKSVRFGGISDYSGFNKATYFEDDFSEYNTAKNAGGYTAENARDYLDGEPYTTNVTSYWAGMGSYVTEEQKLVIDDYQTEENAIARVTKTLNENVTTGILGIQFDAAYQIYDAADNADKASFELVLKKGENREYSTFDLTAESVNMWLSGRTSTPVGTKTNDITAFSTYKVLVDYDMGEHGNLSFYKDGVKLGSRPLEEGENGYTEMMFRVNNTGTGEFANQTNGNTVAIDNLSIWTTAEETYGTPIIVKKDSEQGVLPTTNTIDITFTSPVNREALVANLKIEGTDYSGVKKVVTCINSQEDGSGEYVSECTLTLDKPIEEEMVYNIILPAETVKDENGIYTAEYNGVFETAPITFKIYNADGELCAYNDIADGERFTVKYVLPKTFDGNPYALLKAAYGENNTMASIDIPVLDYHGSDGVAEQKYIFVKGDEGNPMTRIFLFETLSAIRPICEVFTLN